MRLFTLLILFLHTTAVVAPNDIGTMEEPTVRAAGSSDRSAVHHYVRPAILTADAPAIQPLAFDGARCRSTWRSPRTAANLQVRDTLTL